MASSDNGGQIFTLDYKNPRTSQSFNKVLYKGFPAGVMGIGSEMATFTRVDDSNITISPFTCYHQDNTNLVTVRIETLTPAAVACTSSTPYIILRFLWKNVEANYADIMAVAYTDIGTDDIILGRVYYNITTMLTTFDYTKRKVSPIYYLNQSYQQNRNFYVTANEPNSRLVDISLGTATFGSTVVTYAGGSSATIPDTTGTRDDLITLDPTGAIVVIEGVNGAGLPELPNDHILLAYIHRLTTRFDIRGYDITNVPPYVRNTNKLITGLGAAGTLTATDVTLVNQGGVDKQSTVGAMINTIYTPKNKIINGEFKFWQRRNSASPTVTVATGGTTLSYLADKWVIQVAGTSASTVYSQQAFTLGQTDVPKEHDFYLRSTVSNGGDGTNGRIHLSQCIEDVKVLAGITITISFYAKADANKNLAVEITQNFGTTGSTSANVNTYVGTAALTTTWTKFTYTIAVPSISGKTIGTDGNNTSYTALTFWMSAGSAFNTRTTTLGVQTGTFDFTQVQLEVGSIATNFEIKPMTMETLLCQRYCYLLTNGQNGTILSSGLNSTTTAIVHLLPTPALMRISPVFTSADHTKFSAYASTTPYACGASSISIGSVSTGVTALQLGATIATATVGVASYLRTNATTAFAYLEADFTMAIT